MKIITETEICERIKFSYKIGEERISVAHSPYSNEYDFVLCTLENIIANLSLKKTNDRLIIDLLQILSRITNPEKNEYQLFLNTVRFSEEKKHSALSGKRITEYQSPIIKEFVNSCLGEYWIKSDDVLCNYKAMRSFLIGLYCILMNDYEQYFSHIDLIADLDDELIEVKLFDAEAQIDIPIIMWHSTNKIESKYTLYKAEYSGLEDESILDLVSADVIEEEYYINDERFTIAPSILMKQYLSIIEREVNIIITLSGCGNPDGSHLNWYDMKNRVRKRGINIPFSSEKLYKILDVLYKYRNDGMHGQTITNSDYEELRRYKGYGLFKGLSVKKLELKGVVLHPTVDELQEIL